MQNLNSIIDDYDIKILKAFDSLTNGKEIDLSSWETMKKIHKEGRDKENLTIRNRIKKMCNLGLFQIHEESNSIRWIMNKNNVRFINFKFPDGFKKNSIFLKINEKRQIFQLY